MTTCHCGATSKAVIPWAKDDRVVLVYVPEGWDWRDGRVWCAECVKREDSNAERNY